MEDIYNEIVALGWKYSAKKLILFGSRARGNHRINSDIDIAVFGMPKEKRTLFWIDIENISTLLEFDILHVSKDTSVELLYHIEKEGIVLMNRFEEKKDKLKNAVSRLKESLLEYEENHSDTIRDGAIQRFEFCTELTWKVLREYLLEQGYTEINSPKSVMRKAYEHGMIEDDALWLSLLDDRNSTAHIYDEKTAEEIFERIRGQYAALFDGIIQKTEK